MSKKEKVIILCSTSAFLAILFTFTYLFSLNKYEEENKVMSAISKNISKNYSSIKITYLSKYTLGEDDSKNDEIIDECLEKFNKEKDQILKMSKEEIINKFEKEDYKFKEINENNILFCRNLNKYKYEPNKYVISIKDDFVALFKTDDKGNLYIEDIKKDITDIKITELPEGDREYLRRGDKIYQYNTREEGEEAIEAFFRT